MALLLLADCVSDTPLYANRSPGWSPDVSWPARWDSGDVNPISGLGNRGMRLRNSPVLRPRNSPDAPHEELGW